MKLHTNDENVCQGSCNKSNEEPWISSCPIEPESHKECEKDDDSSCMSINDVPLRVVEISCFEWRKTGDMYLR
jgi:hypothetical protein